MPNAVDRVPHNGARQHQGELDPGESIGVFSHRIVAESRVCEFNRERSEEPPSVAHDILTAVLRRPWLRRSRKIRGASAPFGI